MKIILKKYNIINCKYWNFLPIENEKQLLLKHRKGKLFYIAKGQIQ